MKQKKDYKNAEKYYLAGLNYHGKDYYSEDAFLNKLIHLYKKNEAFDKSKRDNENEELQFSFILWIG